MEILHSVTANVLSVLCILHQAQGLSLLGQGGAEKTNFVAVTHRRARQV